MTWSLDQDASAGRRRKPQQKGEQRGQFVAHLAPVHDHVDRSFLEQELGALETLRKLLAHGLLDDAWASKADQRPGLGDDDIAKHGKTRRHAAHGRIGEH